MRELLESHPGARERRRAPHPGWLLEGRRYADVAYFTESEIPAVEAVSVGRREAPQGHQQVRRRRFAPAKRLYGASITEQDYARARADAQALLERRQPRESDGARRLREM